MPLTTVETDLCHGMLTTPIGAMSIVASAKGLRRAVFIDGPTADDAGRSSGEPAESILNVAVAELCRFFEGELTRFSVRLDLVGTEFQLAVWSHLCTIGHGETMSYRQIAHKVARAGSERAVGQANGANQVAVVVPCHRVIRSDGGLCGYAGGTHRKAWLLAHEAARTGLFA